MQYRLQAATRPPRLSPNGDPASPSQVTVKDEPIDEEYNQALISSSAPTDDIKDEPETPKVGHSETSLWEDCDAIMGVSLV